MYLLRLAPQMQTDNLLLIILEQVRNMWTLKSKMVVVQRVPPICLGPPAEYRAFKPCNCICSHCHARFWYEERLTKSIGCFVLDTIYTFFVSGFVLCSVHKVAVPLICYFSCCIIINIFNKFPTIVPFASSDFYTYNHQKI